MGGQSVINGSDHDLRLTQQQTIPWTTTHPWAAGPASIQTGVYKECLQIL